MKRVSARHRALLLAALGLAHAGAALAINPPAETRPATSSAARPAVAGKVLELDWEELVPKDARLKLDASPPAPIHDYLGEGGLPAQQVMDFSVNQELNGLAVKLPGFIVPLDVGKNGLVSEFFLVPYFGACIHVPPPPPNQIVYVRMKSGIALDSIYEAYWITGKMRVQNKATRLGSAAYQLDADKVEIYKY
jgi:hypothetical protein